MSRIDPRFMRDLKRRVVLKCGFPIITKSDCRVLADMISNDSGESISTTTIYRIFMESSEKHKYYVATVSILARFIGFRSWNDFYTDVLLNEDVSGISSSETFGKTEPSLLDFTIRTRSWSLLKEYFDSFANIERQESFQTLGWTIYVALLRNSQLEVEFYHEFANHPVVRKTFFELAADPDNFLPNYSKGLELYIASTPDVNENLKVRDYIFGNSMLLRRDFVNSDLNSLVSRYESVFMDRNFADYFVLTTSVFPLARLYQARWLYLACKGSISELLEHQDWFFKWCKANWKKWSLIERKAVLYCGVEASLMTSMESNFYPRVLHTFSDFVDSVFGRTVKPSVTSFLERTEFNGVRLQRMLRDIS